jgi:transmembrane sensor
MNTRVPKGSAGNSSLAEEAAHWWVVLQEKNCTQADREAFAEWVRRSPERVEAVLRLSMVSTALRSGAVRWPDMPAEDLIRQAHEPSSRIIPIYSRELPTTDNQSSVSVLRSTRMWVSAACLALLVLVVANWGPTGVENYRTAVGEQRSVVLDDGSIVTINTSSEIAVDYSRERRLVRLVRGEALFEVSHDPQRPFDVVVDDVIVRAVGTKFNVDRRAERTTVSVVEGTVKVMPEVSSTSGKDLPVAASAVQFVSAAQQIVMTSDKVGELQQVPDIAPVTAWTHRQLIFENQPLARVAEEFNRYNRHHIFIRSPGLEEREITGVFQANDSYPFLVFVRQIPGVHVDVTAEGDYIIAMGEKNRASEGAKVLL